MLTNIRLRNFKAFKDSGSIEIAPLTVLTGPNSSGKSAIIRAMMALRQTVNNRDRGTAFVPTGDFVDLGPYEDLVFMHDTKSLVSLEVVAATHSPYFKLLGIEPPVGTDGAEISVSVEFAYLKSIDRIYLSHSTVSLESGAIEVRKETKGGKQRGRSYRTSVKFAGDRSVNFADSTDAKFHTAPPFRVRDDPFSASRISAKGLSSTKIDEYTATQLANMTEDSVAQELDSLYYVGPLREKPRRMYISTGETPSDVGTAGELGPAVLWSASEAKQFDSGKLSEWCSRMGLAVEIRLAAVQGGYFRVLVIDPHTGLPVNLPDVGFGTSQILPVLIQGLMAPAGATLLLEQPEIHLHPNVQADLADFLIEVSQRGVGVVVETHSEHLYTRIQRRIAEEICQAEAVALYYVTPSAEGSKIARVELDEFGHLPSAPTGFFDHGFEETFEFMRAVGSRKAIGNQQRLID